MPDYQFLNCFVNNILENLEKKVNSRFFFVFFFREGWSGKSKYN